MYPPPLCANVAGMCASGSVASVIDVVLCAWKCVWYPWLWSMPHRVAQSLADGVSVRKIIESVCEEIRVIMPVLDRLCLPVFRVFWVMRVS